MKIKLIEYENKIDRVYGKEKQVPLWNLSFILQ